MKKFITFILVMGWVLTSYSQKVIQLEETEVESFVPSAQVIFADYANGIVKVRENYAKQFQKDAVKFLVDNFDIYRYLREGGLDSDEISVRVKSSNGILLADYNSEGELLGTYQRFNNIPLPVDIRNQVFASHGMGWTMTKNKYTASGHSDQIDKETYLVVMDNGKKKDRLKITPNRITGVASIEYE